MSKKYITFAAQLNTNSYEQVRTGNISLAAGHRI